MQNRLQLRTDTKLVEFPNHGAGRMQATAFRRSHPEFKRRHLREILQMLPDKICMGEVYELTYHQNS